MAPEQHAAPETVNGRADVYALGCILFELLAHRPLHDPDTLRARPLQEAYRVANPSPLDAVRARGGALPGATQASQTSFIAAKSAMSAR